MKVVVRLKNREGIELRLTATYRPNLFDDYMIQATEMALPFFNLGYYMVHAAMLSEE